MAAGVHVAGQQLGFSVPAEGRSVSDPVGRYECVVPEQDGDGAVRRAADVMRTVLANATGPLHETLAAFGDAVTIVVGQPEQVRCAVFWIRAITVQRRTVEPDTLAVLHLVADDLLRLGDPVRIGIQQPYWMPAFLRHDGHAVRVKGDLDQRPDLTVVGQLLDDKAVRDIVGPLKLRVLNLTARNRKQSHREGQCSEHKEPSLPIPAQLAALAARRPNRSRRHGQGGSRRHRLSAARKLQRCH